MVPGERGYEWLREDQEVDDSLRTSTVWEEIAKAALTGRKGRAKELKVRELVTKRKG